MEVALIVHLANWIVVLGQNGVTTQIKAQKTYNFDAVLQPETSQQEVFDEGVKPIVEHVLSGTSKIWTYLVLNSLQFDLVQMKCSNQNSIVERFHCQSVLSSIFVFFCAQFCVFKITDSATIPSNKYFTNFPLSQLAQ